MTDFLDIAPLTKTVTIRDNEVTVHGVELTDIAAIIFRFPAVADLFDVDGKKLKAPDPALITKLAVPIQAALVAAGADRISEAGAANLTPGERLSLLANIFLLTVPSELGPFVEALTRILGINSAAEKEPTEASPTK